MKRLLIAALGAALLAACSSDPPPASPPAPPASRTATSAASQAASALPEGVYRTHALTRNDQLAAIKAAGFTAKDAGPVRDYYASHKTVVFGIKFQGGQWTEFSSEDGGPDQVGDLGTYTVTGDVLTMISKSVNARQHLRWRLEGAALSFKLVPGDPLDRDPVGVAVYTSGPFYRQR